jgi:putative lipoprotein
MVIPLVTISCSACASVQSDEAKTYVYRCEGEETVIVVTINGDRGHLFSRQASRPIRQEPGTPAFAGDDVYYMPDQPPDLAPGQTAEITIAGRKLANCKNNPRAAVWEAAKLRGVSYRAIGQEPAWVLEIDRGKGFLLVTDYGQKRQQFPYNEAESDAAQRTGRYNSELNGERIEITITGKTCHDSMSGEEFSSQVEIDWREQTLRGCGRALH